MLACARIGAIHSVVFGGFAARSLATRIDDAKPKADRHRRRRHARRQGDPVQAAGRRGDAPARSHQPHRKCVLDRPATRRRALGAGATSTTRTLRAQALSTRRCRARGSSRASPRTSCTRRARPASRKACSATPAAMPWRWRRSCSTSSAAARRDDVHDQRHRLGRRSFATSSTAR